MLTESPHDRVTFWLDVLMRHKTYAALLVVSCIATLAATPIYMAVARRAGWIDRPGGRKQHAADTPTMGGLVIFTVVFAGVAVVMALPNRVGEMLREHRVHVLGACACTALMMLVGAIDDRRGLRPASKLIVEVVLAIAAVVLGFDMPAITLPWIGSVPLGPLSLVLPVVWIVGVTNAVNLADGLDGLAAGIGFLAAAANAVVAIYLSNYYMAVMAILLAGALLGFLRWNFHPARIFLGDTGSLGIGMFLALCSLHSAQKAHTAVMILVPLCALGYPIFDTLLAVARRTLRGQPLFASDREHVHHVLERGHGPSGAAMRIYVASLLLIGVCVLLTSVNHLAVGIGLAIALGLAFFSVRVLGYMEWQGWIAQFRAREDVRIVYAAATLARLKLSVATTSNDVLEALGAILTEFGAVAIEVDLDGETYRWSRPYGSSAATRTVEVMLGDHAARIELRPDAAWPTPHAVVFDELARIAAARLDAGTLPPRRGSSP